jgi:hypothetical protein
MRDLNLTKLCTAMRSVVPLIMTTVGYDIVGAERGSLNLQAPSGARSPQSLATKAFLRVRSRYCPTRVLFYS